MPFAFFSATIDRKAKNHAKNFRPTDVPHNSATPIWRMTTVVKQISHVGETQEYVVHSVTNLRYLAIFRIGVCFDVFLTTSGVASSLGLGILS